MFSINSAYLESIYQRFYGHFSTQTWVIAGGAPRDLALAELKNDAYAFETSDIDIYALDIPTDGEREDLGQELNEVLPALDMQPCAATDNSGGKSPILSKWEFKDGMKIDVMTTTITTPEELVAQFDLRICQCWFRDPERQVISLHPNLMEEDAKGEIIRLVPGDVGMPFSTLSRMLRLRSRWGWKVSLEDLIKVMEGTKEWAQGTLEAGK